MKEVKPILIIRVNYLKLKEEDIDRIERTTTEKLKDEYFVLVSAEDVDKPEFEIIR